MSYVFWDMTIELAPLRYIVFDYWVIIPCPSNALVPCFLRLLQHGTLPVLLRCAPEPGFPVLQKPGKPRLPQVTPRDDYPIIRYN